MSDFENNGAFIYLLAMIVQLNQAMQSAASNPNDDFRRKEVQHAMGMLPGAIRGLAGEFNKNNFGNSDLPMVQKMLGGYIDVHAADGYKKFLANPDKRFIPKLGNIPSSLMAKVGSSGGSGNRGSQQLVFDDSVAKNGSSSQNNSLNQQLASLTDDSSSLNSGASSSGPAKSDSLVFDDTQKKADPSPDSSSNSNSNSSSSASSDLSGLGGLGGSSNSSANSSLASDLAAVEATLNGNRAPDSALDKDFFNSKAQKSAPQDPSNAQTDPSQYKSNVQPQFWSPVPFLKLAGLLTAQPSYAEQGGDDGGDDSKGGKKESGGDAGQALMAMAAMMAAIAPVAAAAITANADKQIAQTNANAQIQMTAIAADTSKTLAAQQANIAMQQAQVAQQISGDNQKAVTDRLGLQLGELDKARTDSDKFEEERLTYQENLDKQRLDIAKQQADQSISLANREERMQEAAALNAAGGGSGGGPGGGPAGPPPSNVLNSAGGLTVQNSLGGAYRGGAGGGFGGGAGFGGGGLNPGVNASGFQGNASTGLNNGLAQAGNARPNSAFARGVGVPLGQQQTVASAAAATGLTTRGITAAQVGASASDLLLSNVGNTKLVQSSPQGLNPANGAPSGLVKNTTANAVSRLKLVNNAPAVPAALKTAMNSSKAAGSTAQNKFVAAASSDLGDLLQKTASSPSANANVAATPYFRPGTISTSSSNLITHSPGSRAVSAASASSDLSKVYNAPNVGILPTENGLTHSPSGLLNGSTGF